MALPIGNFEWLRLFSFVYYCLTMMLPSSGVLIAFFTPVPNICYNVSYIRFPMHNIHPAACALSNILLIATGRPLAECTKSASLLSRILVSTCINSTGVYTAFAPSPLRASSGPSTGVPTQLWLPLRLSGNGRPVPCVVAEYGDPVRVACVEVCPKKTDRDISDVSMSSLYRSHIEYSDIISCAIVAMSGIDTFSPAKKPIKSCGFFELSDDADAWREDRRGDAWLSSEPVECVFCLVCSLVGPCRTSVR